MLARCDAVLSGYQGAADVGAVVLDAVALVKTRNPAAIYCCDPVMGDVGRGFFVRSGIPELMRDRVVPAAQIITPNQFELEFLTGLTHRDAGRGAGGRRRRPAPRARDRPGHQRACTTDAAPDTIDMVAVSGARRLVGDHAAAAADLHRGRRPDRRDVPGPVCAGRDVADAVAPDRRVVYGVLDATVGHGSRSCSWSPRRTSSSTASRRFEAIRLRLTLRRSLRSVAGASLARRSTPRRRRSRSRSTNPAD